MRASVATVRNPFGGASGRELRVVDIPLPIRALAPDTPRPFVCLRNGDALLRRHWDEPLADGDVVAFVVLPQGGGGENGGSDPTVAALTIAVMIAAPWAGVYMQSMALGWGVAGGIGYAAGYGAVMLAGMSLINALVPPPTAPSTNSLQAQAAPSPTYNLQAQGNLARLDAAIPVQYGRLRVYPDLAAQPYIDYQGNEQYLYQLLCIGQGEFDIESINIEDTSITQFDEVTTEVIPPNGALTLFPGNVVTAVEVSGQDMPGMVSGTYAQSGTTITVTQTAHGRQAGQSVYLDFTSGTAVDSPFTIATVPTADTFTVTAAASLTTSGNVNVMSYVGGFIANAAGTQANTVGIDLVCPRGLYNMNTTTGSLSEMTASFTVEMRRVDDSGNPLESWVVVGPIDITAATTTPQRRSYRYPVASGRYEVRLRRTDTEQSASNYGHDLVWGGLRAYLQEDRTFGNVTLLAVKMKASNSLSQQASRKINVTCTRKLIYWDPVNGWNTPPVATRSIAWALADAAMAGYGGGISGSRLDGAELYALDQIWSSRGDTFDGRFDNTITLWEALTKIAQVGRAKPYLQGGVIHVARDGAATVPVALFSQRNIVKGSFSIDYLMPTEDTSDAVDVGYFDETVWAARRVVAALPGSTAGQPAKIELFGCVKRDQAYREGLYHSAANRYRRKIIKFTTEMEGFIPSFGDLIAIQHDMPQWGQGGEIVAWDATTKTITTSEPLTWGTGTHYIGLRKLDGSISGPYVVIAGSVVNQAVLATAPDITPYTGLQQERTHYSFGWGETWRQLAKVTTIRPKSATQVEIEAVAENSNVHSADQGITTPTAPTSQLSTRYTSPNVTGVMARSMPSDPGTMLLTWQPAPGTDHYLIEQSNDGVTWTRTGETSANSYTATALYGAATLVRIAAVGLTRGQWTTVSYGQAADYMWHVPDTTLMWSSDTNKMWSY